LIGRLNLLIGNLWLLIGNLSLMIGNLYLSVGSVGSARQQGGWNAAIYISEYNPIQSAILRDLIGLASQLNGITF
jgi:hypothetical protein